MFIRIVQFKDDKYGIKRGIFQPTFLDTRIIECEHLYEHNAQWWFLPSFVNLHSKFNTLEECEKAIKHYKMLVEKSKKKYDTSNKTIKWFWW